jgi:O-antigen ligase
MAAYRSRYYRAVAAGLLLFGFTLPLSKSAGNVLLFLVYPAVILGALLRKDIREAVLPALRQPLAAAFSLFFLVAFIGVFFTEKYSDGIHVANKFLSLPAIYLMMSVLIQTVEREEQKHAFAENVLASFLIGLMALNIIGLLTFLGVVGHARYSTPLTPLHVHHIWYANVNAIGIYAAASFLLFPRKGILAGGKAFLYSSLALSFLCVLLSIARDAWLGIALTSAIMAFLASGKKSYFIVALAAALAAGFSLYLFVPLVHDRIDLIVRDIRWFAAGKTETSIGMRFLMWKAALKMFLSNPVIGVGTGGYVPTLAAYVKSGLFPSYLLDYNQPHSMYFFALATNGILGLAALLYLFIRILIVAIPLVRGDEEKRLFAFLAVATAVHFMIAGLTDSFFNIQILRYTFVFMIGVCVRRAMPGPCRGLNGPSGRTDKDAGQVLPDL